MFLISEPLQIFFDLTVYSKEKEKKATVTVMTTDSELKTGLAVFFIEQHLIYRVSDVKKKNPKRFLNI